ncbi:unnamed protein product [Vicia faba]|uniref:Thymidylate kinase-like domain-containing protein n=1 Tax=Vicia faba TaxID=3906 RepID=A0AAV1A2Q8_VICFA|nr:unnamed protein product [Vicia faba]
METNLSCSTEGNNMATRGALVVLEGLDRSGKSSQCSRLVSYLEGQGLSAELWRFPDRTTDVGQMIFAYLTNASQLDDHTIHLPFSANHIEWYKAPEIGLLAPDLVAYLDISPDKAAERGGYGDERYEKLEFQKKVAEHYKVLHDASWTVVDAWQPIEDVEKQLQEIVLACVTECQKGKSLSSLWLT